jgi:hypothetical protein
MIPVILIEHIAKLVCKIMKLSLQFCESIVPKEYIYIIIYIIIIIILYVCLEQVFTGAAFCSGGRC